MSAPTVCPKCQRDRQPGEDACAKCGLLVSRWSGFSTELPSHPVLDGLWGKVEEAWQDDARHARFLDEAAAAGALDLAAARYSNRFRADGDARAKAGLDRATHLALQLQKVTADSDLGQAARWLKIVGAAVAVALFLATLWLLAQTFRR